jgi:hypothetical protein
MREGLQRSSGYRVYFRRMIGNDDMSPYDEWVRFARALVFRYSAVVDFVGGVATFDVHEGWYLCWSEC